MRTLALGVGLIVVALAGAAPAGDTFLGQSPGYGHPADLDEWRRGRARRPQAVSPPRPRARPIRRAACRSFGGGGTSSFGSAELGHAVRRVEGAMEQQRPDVDAAARAALEARFALDCRDAIPSATMSRGKPQPARPDRRGCRRLRTWEDYAALAPEDDPPARRLPLEAARSPAALDGAHAVPASSGRRAPRARALRRRLRHPRLLPARVPAAAVSHHAPRDGRRHARRRDHLRQLLRDVQRPPHRRADGRAAPPGDAVPDHLVQRHPPPRDGRARRRAWPASRAT